MPGWMRNRLIKRFIAGMLHEVPMLRAVIEDETTETITLKKRVSIEIHTASFRSTRGYTIVAICERHEERMISLAALAGRT
jgi:hypothetical protein